MAKRLPDKLRGSRRGKPPESLIVAVNNAIDTVYGSDYTFEVRSGIAHPGTAGASSGRHVTTQGAKGAADFKIYDPSGKQLAGRALEPLARHWVSNYGSIGVNSQPGEQGRNFTHLDLIRRAGPLTRVWTYGSIPGFNREEVAALAGTGELYRDWASPEKASVTWTSAAIPTPPNPIPGIADPTAPVPRANPLFAGPAPAPGTVANMWGREDFAVAQPGGYFTQIAGRPVGPAALAQTAEASPDATGEAQVRLRGVEPTPVPRSRPNPLAETVQRIVTQGGLLKKGARGEAVKEIQRLLNARGVTDFAGRPLEVDGKLGTRTRQAIEIYQTLHPHLQSDGILGPRTLTQMLMDTEAVLSGEAGVGASVDVAATLPVAQIAANMGTDLAQGFQSPRALYGSQMQEYEAAVAALPGRAALQAATVPGGRLSPEFVPSTPAYRTGMEGSPELPSRRLAAEMEVVNAFTPHMGGTLGASRGLSFDTLDRDAEPIYAASRAFAERRVAAREQNPRLGGLFEFGTTRDASGRTISEGFSIKGSGAVGVGASAGYRAGLDIGARGRDRRGFSAEPGRPTAGGADRRGFAAQGGGRPSPGTGADRRSTSRRDDGTPSAGTGPGRRAAAGRSSGNVRSTGSFGHTRSGRPIGGV